MQKFFNKLNGFFAKSKSDEDSGATAIEYGLIAALIAVAIIGGASAVGKSTSAAFTEISTQIDANSGGATTTP